MPPGLNGNRDIKVTCWTKIFLFIDVACSGRIYGMNWLAKQIQKNWINRQITLKIWRFKTAITTKCNFLKIYLYLISLMIILEYWHGCVCTTTGGWACGSYLSRFLLDSSGETRCWSPSWGLNPHMRGLLPGHWLCWMVPTKSCSDAVVTQMEILKISVISVDPWCGGWAKFFRSVDFHIKVGPKLYFDVWYFFLVESTRGVATLAISNPRWSESIPLD